MCRAYGHLLTQARLVDIIEVMLAQELLVAWLLELANTLSDGPSDLAISKNPLRRKLGEGLKRSTVLIEQFLPPGLLAELA